VWVYARDERPFSSRDSSAPLFYPSRDCTREHPNRHLASYAGILQPDAFDANPRLSSWRNGRASADARVMRTGLALWQPEFKRHRAESNIITRVWLYPPPPPAR
jgi:hypothetical protein